MRVWELFEKAELADPSVEASALIGHVQDSGDIQLFFKSMPMFAKMSLAQIADVKHRIRRQLKNQISIRDFERALKEIRWKTTERAREENGLDQLVYKGTEYECESGGLVWWKPTREGRTAVRLCNFSAEIVADVVRDDGEEKSRALRIRAMLRNQPSDILVNAAEFGLMNWPITHLGAQANVYPNLKDHTRSAIQQLSTNVVETCVYQHTGWTVINGSHVYLHADGGIGPTGAIDLDVDLDRSLRHFRLPQPPTGSVLIQAVRTALGMLRVAPDRHTIPLFSAVWRAILGPVNISIFLSGPTGSGKTQLAALCQQFFGATMTALSLPAAWESTANALELLAFLAKNALFVVDDFVPKGSATDMARLNMVADRLLRGQGNASGRTRMQANTALRGAKYPRGLILATGEDVPKGHSLRSRMIVCELGMADVDWDYLTECQRVAVAGDYATVTSGFVRWLSPQMGRIDGLLQKHTEIFRKTCPASVRHRRTPDNIAQLAIGFHLFLEFALAVEATTQAEAHDFWKRADNAFSSIISEQNQQQSAEEPCAQFIRLFLASVDGGRAYVSGPDGSAPTHASQWGYRDDKEPRGRWAGWVDGDDLYLEPNLAYAEVQELARNTNDSVTVSLSTLRRRLKQRGFLKSVDETTQTVTLRRKFCGKKQDVLHFSVARLSGSERSLQTQHEQSYASTMQEFSSERESMGKGILGGDRYGKSETYRPNAGFAESAAGSDGFLTTNNGSNPSVVARNNPASKSGD